MLAVVGAALLVVAVVAGVLGATMFVRALPSGVVDSAGAPGSAALASGSVPGEADVSVAAGEPYAVWAVVPPGRDTFTTDDVAVVCAGSPVAVSGPSVSGSSGVGATTARTAAEFTPDATGSCTVSVSGAAASDDVTFVVTEGWRFGEFFATVGGSVLLWIVAVGGGVVGLGLLVGGLVWRAVARR